MDAAMVEPQQPIEHSLDGDAVRRMIAGAAGWVALHREALNQINVFPVPDGDTGANLGRTLAAAVQAVDELDAGASPYTVASTAASAALLGGRGSSGVIGAQWLRGFSGGLAVADAPSVHDLVAALESAADAALHAVSEPRDGTMISVARDSARQAAQAGAADPLRLMQLATQAASESVERTPQQNPVLADAGVVDAGARGLEFMLRGMTGALAGEEIPELPQELGSIDPGWLARRLDVEGDFDGFCTELVVSGVAAPDDLQTALAGEDETVMLAPDGDDLRIHLHTTEPELAYIAASEAGELRAFRAVDMRQQAARTHEADTEPAVVAVVQGAGFVEVFRELGAAALVSGGASDNPSVEMLLSAAESVKGVDVIVLPNHHNVTPAAQRAGELAAVADQAQRFHIIETDSQAEGVAALASLIGGVPVEDVVAEMSEGLDAVSIGQVTYAARRLEGDTPLQEGQPFAMLNGEIVDSGESSGQVALSLAVRMAAESDGSLLTLYWGDVVTEDEADELGQAIADVTGLEVELIAGGQPHYPWLLALE